MVADTARRRSRRAPRRSRSSAPLGWLRDNLFSSWGNTILTVIGLFIAYRVVCHRSSRWAHPRRRPSTGADGERLHARGGRRLLAVHHGQVRPVHVRPLPRSRSAGASTSSTLLALAGLVPLMIPRVPGKFWNAVYVFVVFPVLAFFLLVGGVLRAAARRHVAVGRPAGDAGRRHRRHRRLVPARHPAGARAALEDADRALGLGRLHRVRARRAADHRAVHGLGDAAAVPAAGRHLRQAAARADRRRPVLRRPTGRDRSAAACRRSRAGSSRRPRRSASPTRRRWGSIILPQALKLVIPGIVNSFIGLFKDTSLVLIIGLFDLLGIVQLNTADAEVVLADHRHDRLRVRRLRLLDVLLRHVALLADDRAPPRHRRTSARAPPRRSRRESNSLAPRLPSWAEAVPTAIAAQHACAGVRGAPAILGTSPTMSTGRICWSRNTNRRGVSSPPPPPRSPAPPSGPGLSMP